MLYLQAPPGSPAGVGRGHPPFLFQYRRWPLVIVPQFAGLPVHFLVLGHRAPVALLGLGGRIPAAAASSEAPAESSISASGSRRICETRQQERIMAKECRGD